MKIVAIGGGENGRPGKPYEIKKFDEEIVKMAGKKNPNFLFVGFASKDDPSYFEIINRNFKALNCNCVQLKEKDLIDLNSVKSKIELANIIYVGGGNTLRLMNIFRKHKIDKMLESASKKGTILCGVSAGGICWCDYGNSDSRKFTSNSTQLIKVTGLGFVHALFCPHYDAEIARQEDLKRMMKTTNGVALAFENCTALQIIDNNYKVLKTKDNAKAWKCFWYKGQYIKEELMDSGRIEDLITGCV